jgi:hypothetical protein
LNSGLAESVSCEIPSARLRVAEHELSRF